MPLCTSLGFVLPWTRPSGGPPKPLHRPPPEIAPREARGRAFGLYRYNRPAFTSNLAGSTTGEIAIAAFRALPGLRRVAILVELPRDGGEGQIYTLLTDQPIPGRERGLITVASCPLGSRMRFEAADAATWGEGP